MPKMRRLLIYSHDSFGLGHLRRCRTIAHDLVDRWDDLSVLIISGSPVVGRFSFRKHVDFLRVPGVTKTPDGSYAPFDPGGDMDKIIGLRTALIRQAVQEFRPHLFLVDKEPLGLRGEVAPALEWARTSGTRLVLGLRDVLDAPDRLQQEWARKNAFEALDTLYHDVWIFGDQKFYDPLEGLLLPASVRAKASFTGYLRRPAGNRHVATPERPFDEPFLLVMAGGGGDGSPLIEWVLDTYENQPTGLPPSLIVTGPFMPMADQRRSIERVQNDPRLKIKTFDARIEFLQESAAGFVTMGGYNTFSEMLSRDKPCLMVPRTEPRREQLIRAQRSEELGLLKTLVHWQDDETVRSDPQDLARELAQLPHADAPSTAMWPGMLEGLDGIADLAAPWIGPGSHRAQAVSVG